MDPPKDWIRQVVFSYKTYNGANTIIELYFIFLTTIISRDVPLSQKIFIRFLLDPVSKIPILKHSHETKKRDFVNILTQMWQTCTNFCLAVHSECTLYLFLDYGQDTKNALLLFFHSKLGRRVFLKMHLVDDPKDWIRKVF